MCEGQTQAMLYLNLGPYMYIYSHSPTHTSHTILTITLYITLVHTSHITLYTTLTHHTIHHSHYITLTHHTSHYAPPSHITLYTTLTTSHHPHYSLQIYRLATYNIHVCIFICIQHTCICNTIIIHWTANDRCTCTRVCCACRCWVKWWLLCMVR